MAAPIIWGLISKILGGQGENDPQSTQMQGGYGNSPTNVQPGERRYANQNTGSFTGNRTIGQAVQPGEMRTLDQGTRQYQSSQDKNQSLGTISQLLNMLLSRR